MPAPPGGARPVFKRRRQLDLPRTTARRAPPRQSHDAVVLAERQFSSGKLANERGTGAASLLQIGAKVRTKFLHRTSAVAAALTLLIAGAPAALAVAMPASAASDLDDVPWVRTVTEEGVEYTRGLSRSCSETVTVHNPILMTGNVAAGSVTLSISAGCGHSRGFNPQLFRGDFVFASSAPRVVNPGQSISIGTSRQCTNTNRADFRTRAVVATQGGNFSARVPLNCGA